jgi:predicted SprT family Zn-dependent metalloprotease
MDTKTSIKEAEALAYANYHCRIWWNRAVAIWGTRCGMMPAVILNKRLKSTAGRAWIYSEGHEHYAGKMVLEFSHGLLIKHAEYFSRDTIPHEIAHFIAYRVYGEENHGIHWKIVTEKMTGKVLSRCHSLPSLWKAK